MRDGIGSMTVRTRRRAAFFAALAFAALWPVCVRGVSDFAEFAAPSEMIQSDDAAGRLWAEHIVREAGAKTEYEKIRAICAWYAENIEYDRDSFLRVRDLPAETRASALARYDYLSVLASVADYATAKSEEKPRYLCGGYAYGAAGSLRALGIPVRVEIGKMERTTQKGEIHRDAAGAQRRSAKGGDTPYRYFAGRWVKVTDPHVRLLIWDASGERWLRADPTFDSIDKKKSYFDMNETLYNERWKTLYVSAERMPAEWKKHPLPAARPAPPPAPGTVKNGAAAG
jgi:hypothetical protein